MNLFGLSRQHRFRKIHENLHCLSTYCLHYASNLVQTARTKSHDASVAGGWYFRECQEVLVAASERPSFRSLECYILTILYLSNASYTNIAYNKLGTAIRISHSIGLHHEQEIHRRLWWSLYVLKVKFATELGRPWAFQPSFITCNLPVDTLDVLGLSGANFACPDEEITWLSFHLQSVKLAHSV
jgi:hypothetical protein